MDELIPGERASRDFRVKFPDDVIQDNLAGQLWFGAEVIKIILFIPHEYGGEDLTVRSRDINIIICIMYI